MTSDSEREEQLRRLLAAAVEPVEPGPGAQTRLLARARSQAQHKRRRRADVMRWAVPVTIVSLALVLVTTLGVIAARNAGDGSSKGSSTSAGGTASIQAPAASPDSAAAASPSHSSSGAIAAPPDPSALSNEKQASGGSSGASRFSSTDVRAGVALPTDLDGDGRPDTFVITGGKLIATLSADGVQSVELPPTGAGARVLDIAALNDPSGNSVPVLFVRLRQSGATFTDTVLALVSGRLTVLAKGSEPVELTVDGAHGYGCNQRTLAVSGDDTPYVVDGAQLVPSPNLNALLVPAGKSSGC